MFHVDSPQRYFLFTSRQGKETISNALWRSAKEEEKIAKFVFISALRPDRVFS